MISHYFYVPLYHFTLKQRWDNPGVAGLGALKPSFDLSDFLDHLDF